MFIDAVELGKTYLYDNGTDVPCRVIVLRYDLHVPDEEQSTVYVQAATSHKKWVAMPHQLREEDGA